MTATWRRDDRRRTDDRSDTHRARGGDRRGRSLAAGALGAIVASFCCLPMATALALGLGLGAAAALGWLLAFQRHFQVAGLLLAVFASWWIARRGHAACALDDRERGRVPLYVFGTFGAGFALLNLAVIPLLERLPWLLAGK